MADKEDRVELDDMLDKSLSIPEDKLDEEDYDEPTSNDDKSADVDTPSIDEADEEGESPVPQEEPTPPDGASPPQNIDGDDEEEDQKKKREEGLMKELAKLRADNRKLRNAQPEAPPVIPMPGSTTAPGHGAQPLRKKPGHAVPVRVQGDQVLVDEQALRSVAREEAMQAAREAQQPTPQQMVLQQEENYARMSPENALRVERANSADQFIGLHAQNIMSTMKVNDVNELMQIMQDNGITEQITQYFPELDGMIDEFVTARMSGNALWRRSVLDRIKVDYEDPNADVPNDTPNIPNLPPKPVHKGQLPKAMSRKGGSRDAPLLADEQEFESLESEFREKGIVFFPDDKYKRLESLGEKLEKPGWI